MNMTKDNLPDLDIFLAGTVFRKFEHQIVGNIRPIYKMVIVKYPSRLEAISIDPSKIAERCIDNIYTAGQIDFCVDICKHISVSLRKKENILITKTSSRKSLILHSALLMKKALGFTDGLMIDVKNDLELKHCGLGSSSSIIQGVGAAINELFGKPMRPLEIVRYLVSNHGEEVDGDDTRLMQVQSVGGSGICGHFEGGLIINSGKATPIFRKNLPKNLTVVIGVPKNFVHYDSVTLMNKEMENMDGFKNTGSKFSEKVAYRLIHEVIPSLVNDDYKPCKDRLGRRAGAEYRGAGDPVIQK